jgi:hypothetical protein
MPQFKAFRAQVDAGVLTVTLDDPPLNLMPSDGGVRFRKH